MKVRIALSQKNIKPTYKPMPQSKKIHYKNYRTFEGMDYKKLKEHRKFFNLKEAAFILHVEIGISYEQFCKVNRREITEVILNKDPETGKFHNRGIRAEDLEAYIEEKVTQPAAIKEGE